jgi:transposase-like protein
MRPSSGSRANCIISGVPSIKTGSCSISWRRVAGAAKRFFKRLLKGLQHVPRVLVNDKLGSDDVAKRAKAAT